MTTEHFTATDTDDTGGETEWVATHPLLRRQLRASGIGDGAPTHHQWQLVVERIDRAYHDADRRAAVADRLLAVSSDEIRGRLEVSARLAEQQLAAQRAQRDAVFSAVPIGLVTFAESGRIVAINEPAERLLGDRHELVDRHLEDVVVIEARDGSHHALLGRPELDEALQQPRWERRDVTLRCRTGDGLAPKATADTAADGSRGVPVDVVMVPFPADAGERGGVVVLTDRSDRERADERLAWQQSHDPVTGLATRALVTERIDVALAMARRSHDWPSVVTIDLDRFRTVNDAAGHAGGDGVLAVVASRLQACVRTSDTVARLGGDQFLILCEHAGDADVVRALGDRIVDVLREPFEIGAEHTHLTASVGVAHANPVDTRAEDLLRDAQLAMHEAKRRGGDRCNVADEQLRVAAAERAQLERGLRSAISRREIGVAYQPVRHAASGDLVGFEALARWVHPVLGDVRPNRFVPVAVEAGLIETLGDRMLDLACRDVATWNRERKATGLPPLAVHVNISAHELQSPGLLARLRDAMRRHAVLPSWLVLELTETMLLDDPDVALERLRELKRAGIRVAIDDYGTGYSSLSYLRRYPVHMVKIDREFISEIVSSKHGQSIVKAMIDLAHGLGHEVLAEGVETNAELEVLRTLDCGFVQGYLLGMPMPSEEALLLAASSRTETPNPAPSASAGTARLLPLPEPHTSRHDRR